MYAAIAPASPHALHTPSHIFSRLGYWQESLDSNIASARVAAEWVGEGKDGLFDEQHALNHVEYADLQLGQDRRAFEQIAVMQKLAATPGGDPWWPIAARIYYDLETHNWAGALQIAAPVASPFAENLDVFWIHTIAAARLNNNHKTLALALVSNSPESVAAPHLSAESNFVISTSVCTAEYARHRRHACTPSR